MFHMKLWGNLGIAIGLLFFTDYIASDISVNFSPHRFSQLCAKVSASITA